jgi:hypothetical protein
MYVLRLPKLTFAINNGGSTTQNFEISFPLDFNVGEKRVREWLMPCYITTRHQNVRVWALASDYRFVEILIFLF